MANVTFWQFPDEESTLLRYINATCDVIAYRAGPVDDPAALTSGPLMEYIEQYNPDSLYLGPLALRVQPVPFVSQPDGQRLYCYDWSSDPLINYNRPQYSETGKLMQAVLCADWTDYDDNDQLVRKPEAFIKWAQRIFRYARKLTPRWHMYRGYRATERAAEAIAAGLPILP